jgi:hypothetical protein
MELLFAFLEEGRVLGSLRKTSTKKLPKNRYTVLNVSQTAILEF